MEFLKSLQKTPSFTRNPFEVVEQGVCQKHPSQAPEKRSSIHPTMIPKQASFKISVNTSKEIEESRLRRREEKIIKCERTKASGASREKKKFRVSYRHCPMKFHDSLLMQS